jgi:opacity protein-like surface antigen
MGAPAALNQDEGEDLTKTVSTRISLICLTAGLLLGAPVAARAQGFIIPYVGFDFGDDAQCPAIDSCEKKVRSWGVALGHMGSAFGFEEEFGYGKDFFGSAPGLSSSVFTIMNNVMLSPRLKVIRPYFLGGVGLIRTSVDVIDSPAGIAGAFAFGSGTDNNFGWDLGGGVILGTKHIGIRGDLRYFHTFDDVNIFGTDVALADRKLDFGRLSVGLYLGF